MPEEPRVPAELWGIESAKWVARIREGDVILVGHALKRVAAVYETEPRTFTLEPFREASG